MSTEIVKEEDFMETAFELNTGAFLLCPPFNMSAKEPNNIWMKELAEKGDIEKSEIDRRLAYNEWSELYHSLASSSLVYVLPNKPGLQDQIYTANLGIVLPHLEERNVIISKFKSTPRTGEEQVGIDFFNMMDFKVHHCPEFFEGEADLKYLRDDIYIGGYGQRSSIKSYDWMREKFNMNIIPIRMTDEYLYHLDCMVFPLNTNTVMACTELMYEDDIKALEKVAEIVDVDADLAYQGICNSVRNYSTVYQSSNLETLSYDDELYEIEKYKVETTVKICQQNGLEPLFINLSECMKSGAMLSCTVMHLNYVDYQHNNV